MKFSILLVAILAAGAAPAVLAQENGLDPIDEAAFAGMDLTPAQVEEFKRLEADLVEPVLVADHGFEGATTASDAASDVVYSPVSEAGFPVAAMSQENFADGTYWMLDTPLEYHPGHTPRAVVVPAGFVHDFASVPDAVTPLVPKYGPYNRAAIVHDFLYWAQPCTRLQSDNIFLIAMIEARVSPWRRWGIFKGVRLGGWPSWSSDLRERNEGRPRVVPETHRPIPANATWAKFRASLFDAGVRDSVKVDDKTFCELGNSTAVPAGLMAEASP
jgi:hypothetical protein